MKFLSPSLVWGFGVHCLWLGQNKWIYETQRQTLTIVDSESVQSTMSAWRCKNRLHLFWNKLTRQVLFLSVFCRESARSLNVGGGTFVVCVNNRVSSSRKFAHLC